MNTTENIWGPSAYTLEDARPWHNLPAAIGAAPPHKVMQGLSFAYALSVAENMADVHPLKKAAYAAWQAGFVGDDFKKAATHNAAEVVSTAPLDIAAETAALAYAVRHFSGGMFLAEGLRFIAEGDAVIETQFGFTRTPEAEFKVAQKLLSLWAGAYHGEMAENMLIFTLAQLTPPEIAELSNSQTQELQQLHTLHVARLFLEEAHIVDEVLQVATQKAIAALTPIVAQQAANIFGVLEKPNPLGVGLKGAVRQLALEGVYPWPHPRVMGGKALGQAQAEALQQAYAHRNLTAVLEATFQSPTFKALPTAQAYLKAPKLNRQNVLQRLVTLTFTV